MLWGQLILVYACGFGLGLVGVVPLAVAHRMKRAFRCSVE